MKITKRDCPNCEAGKGGVSITLWATPGDVGRIRLTINSTPEYTSTFDASNGFFSTRTFTDVPSGSELTFTFEGFPAVGMNDENVAIYKAVFNDMDVVAGQLTDMTGIELIPVVGQVFVKAQFPANDFDVSSVNFIVVNGDGMRVNTNIQYFLDLPEGDPAASYSQDADPINKIVLPVGTARTITVKAYMNGDPVVLLYQGTSEEFEVTEAGTDEIVVTMVNQTGLGQGKFSGSLCEPNCVGRECGDDGCGGTCGGCPENLACDLDGQCSSFYCYGDRTGPIGDLPPIDATKGFLALAFGEDFICRVAKLGDPITCWGANDKNQLDAPTWLGAADAGISAGRFHACAIDGSYAAACWGDNTYGQTDVPSETAFLFIAAGLSHTCGIKDDGSAVCWGDNTYGQLNAPAEIFNTLGGIGSPITAGLHFTCGLKQDKTVACWGDNTYGQLDAPTGEFEQISAGANHVCGMRENNTVECWGDNRYGQSDVPETTFMGALSSGAYHSCAMSNEFPTILCWGCGTPETDFGQCASPPFSFYGFPIVGDKFSCAAVMGIAGGAIVVGP